MIRWTWKMNNLREAIHGLLWSQWSELGIPGTGRRHQSIALDPEPLIAWTPHLAANEPRLVGLAFDWCVANAAQVSKSRLRGLAKTMPDGAVQSLAGFNGALNQQGVCWQPKGTPSSLSVDRSVVSFPMERPALVRFRIRALCGASARAEALALCLASNGRDALAANLTPAGITRRSIERVLNELVAAGLLIAQGTERRRRFRLRELRAFESFVQGAGVRWIDWPQVFSLAAVLHLLAEQESQSPNLRRVRAAGQSRRLTELALNLNLEPPPGPVERVDLFESTMVWGAAALRQI